MQYQAEWNMNVLIEYNDIYVYVYSPLMTGSSGGKGRILQRIHFCELHIAIKFYQNI